jgi:hypothetical protein
MKTMTKRQLAEKLGIDEKTVRVVAQKLGIKLSYEKQRSGRHTHRATTFTNEQCEQIENYRKNLYSEKQNFSETSGRVFADTQAQILGEDGSFVIKSYKAGTPDLIILSPKLLLLLEKDKSLLQFVEIKAKGDSLKKDQHLFILEAEKRGIISRVIWE